MDVDRFLNRATHPDVEVDQAKLRAIVQGASSVTQAREEMRKYAWNQAAADRIIQELVLEDAVVNREEFAAQMPLVEPRKESSLGCPKYADDLGPMGETRYLVRDKPDTETVAIVKEEYEFVGLRENGSVAAHWTDVDSLALPEEDLPRLKSLIESFPTEKQ